MSSIEGDFPNPGHRQGVRTCVGFRTDPGWSNWCSKLFEELHDVNNVYRMASLDTQTWRRHGQVEELQMQLEIMQL